MAPKAYLVHHSSIPEYAFVQPYSFIVLYGDDGKGYYDADCSADATNIITNIINSERFPFSDMIPADYEGENADIQKWMRTFPDVDPAKADRLRVPKSLPTRKTTVTSANCCTNS